MFEFLVFRAGGLVLWPADAESQKTKKYVDHHIQAEVLGSRDAGKCDDKFKVFSRRNAEHDLWFSITVNKQISQQINYLPNMLEAVESRFLHQFERILDRKDTVMLLSTMFAAFDVSSIIDEYRGMTGTGPRAAQTPPAVSPTKPVVNDTHRAESVARSGSSSQRQRFTDRKVDQTMVAASMVIGGSSAAAEESVEQYDLDDFEGVFAPTKKPATRLSSLFKTIVGEKTLTTEAMEPVLEAFERHLIEKNVAAHIAGNLTKAVGDKLVGTKCGNFANVKNIVTASLKEAIERILTPDRNMDIIRDVQNAKARGEPYMMAFVGVNGVGKSTSLSKVAYLFKSHGFSVIIAACDTYRTGAVEQLEVHAKRLDIAIYQRGGGRKDPVPVAKQAKDYAKENGFDVLLIDTAGRMQNDLNLMRQIARLVNSVKPDLTVFVAEALVGNNGAEQIQVFDKTLREHNGGQGAQGIDGIILTKFDTIDDKVGASLTLVFDTGHPIVFLGVGQHYRDLRRMNPEFVVSTVLQGF